MPQPKRKHTRHRTGKRDKAGLDQPSELAAGIGQALRNQDHHREVSADDEQRERAERERARRTEPQVSVVTQCADGK